MSHRNKTRAYEQETEITEAAEDAGFNAKRAYASVGTSLTDSKGETLTEDVDNIIYQCLPSGGDLKVQAKRRKRIAQYIFPPPGADITALRQDGDTTSYAVVPLPTLLTWLKQAQDDTDTQTDTQKIKDQIHALADSL